ncbi:Protein FAR-RED IMPAIRED RESPONSE 1 [Bienertia sinuspersici]
MGKQYGGLENVSCIEKDIRNYIDKERRIASQFGDANLIEDYQKFGDVVSFDTTYITNRFKMPFAPFIGVNNHFQSTIFGCALLSDETAQTFEWVMKAWLRAMNGKAPNAILTDQDRAMRVAIAGVFPNTRHRFCLWHIMRKVPEKIGHIIQKHEDFMEHFQHCMCKTWTEECFERRWSEIIETFEIQDEKWLQSLYEDRKQWVPTFMRDMFFAGMSTTQRSESINSFCDKYVSRKTTLQEFVDKYKQAVKDRKRDENQANAKCNQKTPTLKIGSPFEVQVSKLYTHAIFKKFQYEILAEEQSIELHERSKEQSIVWKKATFDC